jgi:hypothetical protein
MKQIICWLFVFVTVNSYGQVGAEYYKAMTVQPDYGIVERGMALQMQMTENMLAREIEESDRTYRRQLEALRQKEHIDKLNREKAQGDMRMYRNYYNSMPTYPDAVRDGWHLVMALDNDDFCGERKVYVSNNRVIRYVVDNWSYRTVGTSFPITKGKSLIQLTHSDGSTSHLEILFLNYIVNPNASTPPPLETGRVSFWTDFKYCTDVEVYFSGMYVGKFDTYFPSGNPTCGQSGTLTVTYKPGVYYYKAKSKSGSWSGTVTIEEGSCSLRGLTD